MKHRLAFQLNRKNRDTGATMVAAIIIIGILMIFIFSLMLVTYNLYASQNKNVASKRNSEAAYTLSNALATEISDENAVMSSDLWRYLRFNIAQNKTWPYYIPNGKFEDHNEEAAFRYFKLDYNYVKRYFPEQDVENSDGSTTKEKPESLDGFPGSVKVCIYWRLPETVEEGLMDGSTITAPKAENVNKNGIRLFVEIICETASQTYVVTNQYQLSTLGFSSEQYKLKNKLSSCNTNAELKSLYNPYNCTINEEENWIWEYKGRE